MTQPDSTRRDFLKTSALATAGATLLAPHVYAADDDKIKVGVIGCGGRGSGAAENVLESARGVEIVALGDYFEEKTGSLRNRLMNFAQTPKIKELGNTVNIPQENCFSGIDNYKKVIESDANYIILATPPGFRPTHLQAAVDAGKNVFTEKPVAVDGPGTRKVLQVYELANQKKLGIGAGTQRRHQYGYLETMKRIHDGAIGDIVNARCYWNGGFIWFRPRKPGMTDLDYQLNNWYHFLWVCGDHICEQHIHNIDVVNWAMGQHPIRAMGMGGRVRPYQDPNVDGNIFNFHAVDFEYPNGIHVLSTCRQINNCDKNVSEALVGTKGTCIPNRYEINGEVIVDRRKDRESANPYVQEHTDLINSIRAGKPINELKNVAESTLATILGRTATYTGQIVTWDQILNSKTDTMPANLDRNMTIETPPLPVPGKTEWL